MSTVTCIWEAEAELGEGAFWHQQEQALYWVDIIRSQLHRYRNYNHGDTEKRSWNFPGGLSSVVACKEGGLLATFASGVAHIDPDTAKVTELHALEKNLPNNRFNDGCNDSHGNFWFGSMDDQQTNASGSFYRLSGDGEISRMTSPADICITNGPAFTADGKWGYFTNTLERKIYRAALTDKSHIRNVELHITFDEADGYPDGMCTDNEGYLWVCHWGGARVTRFCPNGSIDQVITLPVPNVTKCTFGGRDLSTLYITTAATGLSDEEKQQAPQAGGVFAIKLKQQGCTFPAVSRSTL